MKKIQTPKAERLAASIKFKRKWKIYHLFGNFTSLNVRWAQYCYRFYIICVSTYNNFISHVNTMKQFYCRDSIKVNIWKCLFVRIENFQRLVKTYLWSGESFMCGNENEKNCLISNATRDENFSPSEAGNSMFMGLGKSWILRGILLGKVFSVFF